MHQIHHITLVKNVNVIAHHTIYSKSIITRHLYKLIENSHCPNVMHQIHHITRARVLKLHHVTLHKCMRRVRHLYISLSKIVMVLGMHRIQLSTPQRRLYPARSLACMWQANTS